MIKFPFTPATFATELKQRLSGVNVTFDYYNLESTLAKVAKDMEKVLGAKTYALLVEYYKTPDPGKEGSADAVDALQRAMIHFAFYHHLIFVTVRVGNDGVTVKKNDDETTAFKYQTDELNDKLIETAWFWMGELYAILAANPASFPDWATSDQAKALADLPVSPSDFEYWFGVSDAYFVIKAASLVRKVYDDEILPRMKADAITPATGDSEKVKSSRAELSKRMRRAIVYKVMALACKSFAFFELPEPIRKDYDNEMGKNHSAQADQYVRSAIYESLNADAERYLREMEVSVELLNRAITPPDKNKPIVREVRQNGKDKFVFPG